MCQKIFWGILGRTFKQNLPYWLEHLSGKDYKIIDAGKQKRINQKQYKNSSMEAFKYLFEPGVNIYYLCLECTPAWKQGRASVKRLFVPSNQKWPCHEHWFCASNIPLMTSDKRWEYRTLRKLSEVLHVLSEGFQLHKDKIEFQCGSPTPRGWPKMEWCCKCWLEQERFSNHSSKW